MKKLNIHYFDDHPQFYGRRKGRKLSKSCQLAIIEGKDYLIKEEDIFNISCHQNNIVLEIGFGDGENLIKSARINSNFFYIGADPFLNTTAKCLSQILEDLNLIINENKDLEEYKLSEIEVTFEENKQKKILISEVKNYINSFNFEEAAIKYSLTTTAPDGGNLGWINSAGMSEKLLNIVKEMEKDEISEPIISTNTILFLKLIDKRIVKNPEKLDIDELKNSIIQNKKNEMLNLYANSHLSKKRNITSIKFLNE